MNIICSGIEAVTATTQLIGTTIGNLSCIWSWASGLLHCAEGTIMNPIISTVCGPIIGGGGGALLGGGCGTVLAAVQDLIGGIPFGQIIQSFAPK